MNLGSFNDGCGKIDSELKELGFEKKIEEKVCKVVGYLNAKLLRKREPQIWGKSKQEIAIFRVGFLPVYVSWSPGQRYRRLRGHTSGWKKGNKRTKGNEKMPTRGLPWLRGLAGWHTRARVFPAWPAHSVR
jgi:hypothetical protein